MRAPREANYGLEDRLGAPRALLAGHVHGGVRLSAEDVRALCEALCEFRDEAAAMARDLSAKRWNDRAAADPLVDIVLAEVKRPGSNVVLWPVMARPLPGDAAQRLGPDLGGAA